MEIYTGGRGNDKTYKAIELSAKKQMPIVCYNFDEAKRINKKALEMGFRIPEPIPFHLVREKVIGNRRGLIIDDLDWILKRIFDDDIVFATMENCEIYKE